MMKEAEPLEYGKLTAKDYIPGAEILPETSEVEERQQEQGCTVHEEFSHSLNITVTVARTRLPNIVFWS